MSILQFNQNVARLPTDDIFMSSAVLFNIAFVTFDTIKSLRDKYIRQKHINNFAVLHKTRTKLQLLEPQDRAEDPYLIAVLIALAQAQGRRQRPNSQNVDATQSFKVYIGCSVLVPIHSADVPSLVNSERLAMNRNSIRASQPQPLTTFLEIGYDHQAFDYSDPQPRP